MLFLYKKSFHNTNDYLFFLFSFGHRTLKVKEKIPLMVLKAVAIRICCVFVNMSYKSLSNFYIFLLPDSCHMRYLRIGKMLSFRFQLADANYFLRIISLFLCWYIWKIVRFSLSSSVYGVIYNIYDIRQLRNEQFRDVFRGLLWTLYGPHS